ncbi:MAG: hypothetical protein LUQ66_03760 [Methanoregula sp.]|nr:hypothetical protein [Methanoregula sp.]
MLADIHNPLTLKIMGLGQPLHEAERIASVLVIWVVLLCAMTGYTICPPGPEGDPGNLPGSFGFVTRGNADVTGCGIFPAVPGTAVGLPHVPVLI